LDDRVAPEAEPWANAVDDAAAEWDELAGVA